jgi:ribonucleoside-diphosphate reductase alpha chain
MSDVRPEHPVRATTAATRARFTVADETAEVRDPAHGELSENALRVLRNRYLKKDDQGQVVETPLQMFHRVADAVARAERQPEAWSTRFFEMMWNRSFMPNSPTLMNAGRPLGMLSACFVLPLEDSIADIMETARQIALVQRAGGGTGIDLSRLRPSARSSRARAARPRARSPSSRCSRP